MLNARWLFLCVLVGLFQAAFLAMGIGLCYPERYFPVDTSPIFLSLRTLFSCRYERQ